MTQIAIDCSTLSGFPHVSTPWLNSAAQVQILRPGLGFAGNYSYPDSVCVPSASQKNDPLEQLGWDWGGFRSDPQFTDCWVSETVAETLPFLDCTSSGEATDSQIQTASDCSQLDCDDPPTTYPPTTAIPRSPSPLFIASACQGALVHPKPQRNYPQASWVSALEKRNRERTASNHLDVLLSYGQQDSSWFMPFSKGDATDHELALVSDGSALLSEVGRSVVLEDPAIEVRSLVGSLYGCDSNGSDNQSCLDNANHDVISDHTSSKPFLGIPSFRSAAVSLTECFKSGASFVTDLTKRACGTIKSAYAQREDLVNDCSFLNPSSTRSSAIDHQFDQLYFVGDSLPPTKTVPTADTRSVNGLGKRHGGSQASSSWASWYAL